MLAIVNAQNGDAEQALALGEDTLARSRKSLGPDHPTTLGAAAAVTIALTRLGATEQATTLGADTLARSRNRLGPDHPITRILTQVLTPTQP